MSIRPGLSAIACLVVAAVLLLGASPSRASTLLVHDAHHFQIEAPEGWYTWRDLNLSGGAVDLMIRGSMDASMGPVGGVIAITSEARILGGTSQEALAILQEGIDNVSATVPGFRILEPPSQLTVGGNAAARVVFWTQPSTYDVYQILLVVTSAPWGRFWAVSGGVFSWDVPTIGPVVNASLATFAILPAPPALQVGTNASLYPWLLLAALAGAGAEGGVLGFMMWRQSRRPQ